jgi:ASPIC and UnbV/FG-GAP-like repeat/Fibronectin type III domain
MHSRSFVRRLLPAGLVALAAVVLLRTPPGAVVAAQEVQTAPAGVLSFTDITVAAGMASSLTGSHGAFWADATGDGRPDLFLTYNECRGGLRANKFYRNLGGFFVEEAAGRGLARLTGGSHGGAFVDLDNDGDYDLLEGTTYETDCPTGDPPALPNRVFRNDGGVFTDVTPLSIRSYPPRGSLTEGFTRSILGFDMDNDGDLDIFAVNGDRGSADVGDRNELYRNDGGFNFTAITTGPLVTTPAGQAGTDVDYDMDGDMDIIVPDFGGFNSALGDLGVIRNDGGGRFTKVPKESIGIVHRATTGISTGDLNNDGITDLVLLDQNREAVRPLGFDRIAYIYLGLGGGRFTFLAEVRGIPGYTAGLADLDNDGDLDLTFPGLPFVLLNDGAAHFTQGPSYPTPRPAQGCVNTDCFRPDPRTVSFADIDDDGDLDSIVTVKFGPFATIRNNFDAGNWIKVQLTSPFGQAGAFGSKVRVYRTGTSQLVAFREAKNVYGYLSQDDPVMHIGLGTATSVDVDVTFLDGTRVIRQNVAANQRVVFNGAANVSPPGAPTNLTSAVAGLSVTLNWTAPSQGPATAYQVEAGSAPGLSNLAVVQIVGTTFGASAPPGTYYVRVRARNAAGLGPPSNEVAVVIGGGGCTIPNAPGTLSFSVAGTLVNLNWSAPAGGAAPAAYVIEAGSAAGAANLAVIDTGGPVLSLAANAPPGRYFVRVKARTACGAGPASNEVVIDVP